MSRILTSGADSALWARYFAATLLMLSVTSRVWAGSPLLLVVDSPVQLNHGRFSSQINIEVMTNTFIKGASKAVSMFDLNTKEYRKFEEKILGAGCTENKDNCDPVGLWNYKRRVAVINHWLAPYAPQSATAVQSVEGFFAGAFAGSEIAVLSLFPSLVQVDDLLTFVHGTHVTGIAAENLPPASVITYPVLRAADEITPQIFSQIDQVISNTGVRVVNMSWEADYKSTLSKYKAGAKNPQSQAVRTKLENAAAARILQLKQEMHQLMRHHPNVVFVLAAGNDRRDFDQGPENMANLSEPNALVVGSLSGQFSNWGRAVNAKASGFRRSSIPVGGSMNMMGTSISAAVVANSVAKEFASHPDYAVSDILRKFGSPL